VALLLQMGRSRDYNGGSKIHAAMQKTSTFNLASVTLTLCTAALMLSGSAVWAEKADRNKAMNAEADTLRYDDLKQTSVFTGNVVITKGTIIIRGAQVDVRLDPEGFQFGTAVEKSPKRAFFRQKRDVERGAIEEWIEGEAETIVYDGKADTVTFSKNAILRRYKGATVSDETQGNQIVYDNTTDVFNVVGGLANATAANPTGRVRTMISPKQANNAVVGATATAGSSPASPATPAAKLRPAQSLGGEPK
jgi:lipopolysaccharide export system protein LptA